MSGPVEQPPQGARALRLHRQLDKIWATGPGWQRLAAVNHSVIGLRMFITSFTFFLIAGVLGMLTRVQLATPHSAFLDAETYNQVFTVHGSMMLFLFAIPMVESFAVYLTPKILGTRDFAFPRLTAYGYWCYLFGATIVTVSLFAGRGARRRLVHVHAAQLQRLHPGHQCRHLAARHDLRRDLGAVAGHRDHRLGPEDARAAACRSTGCRSSAGTSWSPR